MISIQFNSFKNKSTAKTLKTIKQKRLGSDEKAKYNLHVFYTMNNNMMSDCVFFF